jgi:hypothetical protein
MIPLFPVGTRVEDKETGRAGTVLYAYTDPVLAGEVVVKFDKDRDPLAVSVDSLRATAVNDNMKRGLL